MDKLYHVVITIKDFGTFFLFDDNNEDKFSSDDAEKLVDALTDGRSFKFLGKNVDDGSTHYVGVSEHVKTWTLVYYIEAQ